MQSRIDRLRENLPPDMDAALITSPVGRRYYTGMPSSAGTLLVTREDAVLYVDFRYFEAAREAVDGCRVELQTDLPRQLEAAARRQGLRSAGVECGQVTLEQARKLKAMLGDVELITDDRLEEAVRAQRRIKSPREQSAIREAQRLSEEAFVSLLPSIRPGRTERELALELEFATRRLGSQEPPFGFIVVGGPNSSRPHGQPGERPLQKGDLVTFDFGSMVDGYCSDMTRTLAVGEPGAFARDIHRLVLRAQRAALSAIRPGVRCADVDAAARSVIREAGWGEQFGHSLGHGVGLEVHESPSFSAASEDVCREGMVVSVEPGVYVEGRCGCRIEDLICITEDGCENFNQSSKDLLIL